MEQYSAAAREASAEFTEKKSVFIGTVAPVCGEDEAKTFVERISARFPDATHNVYAYILRGGAVCRFSDDGEPNGTAGMPALEVLRREGLSETALVVTRYFGGILLGAGGLTRAYAKAAKLAIDAAGIATFRPFDTYTLSTDYTYYEKIRKEMPAYGVKNDGCDFAAEVVFSIAVDEEHFPAFSDFVRDLTGNKARFVKTGSRYDA